MGLGYNAAPSAGLMDMLSIATHGDGTTTVTVLGDGRAAGTGHTNTKVYGFLDHRGTFSGHADSFIVSNASTQYACWDGGGTSDITEADADYHAVGGVFSYSADLEIVGDYIFSKNSYFGNPPDKNIQVIKRTGPGAYTGPNYWYQKPTGDAISPLSYTNTMAAAEVRNPTTGGVATAVYAGTNLDATAGTKLGITMFVDLNGDGDAKDAGENKTIADLAGTLPAWWGTNETFTDIEAVKGDDGKLFLLVVGSTNTSWGTTLTVMELQDNGEFGGDWTNKAKAIARAGGYGGVKPGVLDVAGLYQSFEFDATSEIPEPGTLLLIGTGILGAPAWGVRRRRMT
jgi:hypothetical protein